MKQVLLVDDLSDALEIVEAAVQTAFAGVHCLKARGVHEALALIEQEAFDLALIDLSLADGQGHQIIAPLAHQQPTCAIVVSTIHDDDDHLFQALQSGAHGYLLKDHPIPWLATQLQGILHGQPPLSPAIARRLLRHFQTPPLADQSRPDQEGLSTREREVLGMLAQGERIADIGRLLGISRHTAGDHVKNIYRKLNISSRAEAALRARGMGLA